MLSTRYGKIEDLVLSLRVALAGGELIDTVSRPAPRRRPRAHAALRRLARARSGSSPARRSRSSRCRPSAASSTLHVPERRGRHRGLPAHARRRLPPVGDPHVRRGGDRGARSRPSSARRWTASAPSSCFEGEPAAVAAEGARTVELARAEGARELDPALAQRWWDRRYEFYKPPHHPELPAIWGTIDVVASYTRIVAVHQALQTAVRDRYAAAGPPAADALLALVPLGHDDLRPLPGPRRRRRTPLRAARPIWEDGITAVLAAGGVMNDHHGVGLKLAPYMAAQHGAALDDLARGSSPR